MDETPDTTQSALIREMMKPFCFVPPFLAALIIMAADTSHAALFQQTEAPDFIRDVKPIFEGHCVVCHCEERDEAGFRMDEAESVLGFIEVNDAEASELYEYLVTDDEDLLMPPPDDEDGIPLSDEQIAIVKRWIDAGAEWPDGLTLVSRPANIQESVPPPVGQEQPGDKAAPDDGPAVNPPQIAERSMGERIWLAIGPLHPAIVHLPIGLLLGAGLFALFSLRGNFVMGDCAYYCLWLGAIGCILASVAGWSWQLTESPYSRESAGLGDLFDTSKTIFLHRITGIAASLFALLLALYASAARAADPDDGLVWKLGTILLAAGIGYVGHSGGDLHYGTNHYRELKSVIQDITGMDLEARENNPGKKKAFEKEPEQVKPEGNGEASEESDNDEDTESDKVTTDKVT